MKNQFIEDFKSVGESVDSKFSVKYKHPPREYKNGLMFTIGLADKTGEIEATYWGGRDKDKIQQIYDSFSEDSVIRIIGKIGEFRTRFKIDVNEEMGKIEKTEEYDIADFVARAERDIEEMATELKNNINAVDEENLKKLLSSFFDDQKFFEDFKKAPAAMYIHHAYIGGLLEHTLHVTNICKAIAEIYPQLNKSLLITGAILHDIGKIKEFRVKTNIKQTEEGMLRGHITMGEEMILEKIRGMPDFPHNLKIKLAHIMLSHHGSNEYGSPVEPTFPEAVAVYYADELDSKVEQYIKMREGAQTEDFRTYSKRLGSIYLK